MPLNKQYLKSLAENGILALRFLLSAVLYEADKKREAKKIFVFRIVYSYLIIWT